MEDKIRFFEEEIDKMETNL